MTNIELYINDALTDLAKNFSVRLNRQLINPAELNTKDAQFSFSISLPPTANNHKAMAFANIEEIKGKFNKLYKATLIINSVRIFIGNFRLTEVSSEGYKGNLYVPAVKSIKDIFGDVNLNQVAEYRVPFADFATSISAINNAAINSPQMAIFPFAMYGLLPKVPQDKNATNYSARDLWDNSVRFNMQDVPPFINPLMALKHIFNSQGLELFGSAFNDPKLVQLYKSYSNPTDYVQPWNYGYHGKVELFGSWASTINKRSGGSDFEKGISQTSDRGYNIYSADLFDATNTSINVTQDPGRNVLYKEVSDTTGKVWAQTQVRIPASGYYKVRFLSFLRVFNNANWRATDPATGVQHISGDGDKHINDMLRRVYEVKLLRDRKTGDFGINSSRLDGGFYERNQPQNFTFDGANIPKYFPQVPATGQINLIDPVQNRKYMLGFGFGSRDFINNFLPLVAAPDNMFLNPRDSQGRLCQIGVAKPGLSWDSAENTLNQVGVKTPGYWKYGRLGSFDNEGDNPDEVINTSAGTKVNGMVLDFQGNPQAPDPGNLTVRFSDYKLSSLTGFQVADDFYQSTDFIDTRNYTGLKFSGLVPWSPDTAVVACYDSQKMFLGATIEAPTTGQDTYNNEPIPVLPGTVYVRMSANVDNPLTITGTDVTSSNIILHRFPLEQNFTYEIETPADFDGFLYVHDGSSALSPSATAVIVDGQATFSTSGGIAQPMLTLYLKTASYDISTTMVLRRTITDSSSDVIGWELTNKLRQDWLNSPDNYVYRTNNWQGNGSVNAVVWLEAGELLTVAAVSQEGFYRRDGMHTTAGMTNHEVDFSLRLEPFRIDNDWLKIDFQGHGTAVMNWSDPVNFDVDSINLMGFLDANIKVNDFIENFVKAFNLKLTQVSPTAFALDVKQSKAAVTSRSINLDGVASVRNRINTPLGLPSTYKIGFTVNQEEEGYFLTKDDGGGEFNTGSIEEKIIEQKSNFSFNWFKSLTKTEAGGDITIQVPLITKHEAWITTTPYAAAQLKRYTDLPSRFVYLAGILPGTYIMDGKPVAFAQVSNSRPDSVLNYKNAPHSLMRNYFTLLGIGSESHYTEAEATLSAYDYNALDGSHMVTFNGDQYYCAEIEGYDPSNRNKAKLKLIRKI